MNLNKALQILKNNNYLVETLNPKYTDWIEVLA